MTEGWAMGGYTPEQEKVIAALTRFGFKEVSTFPNQPDAEGQGGDDKVVVVLQKKSRIGSRQCEVDPEGMCNGVPVQQYLTSNVTENRFAAMNPGNPEAQHPTGQKDMMANNLCKHCKRPLKLAVGGSHKATCSTCGTPVDDSQLRAGGFPVDDELEKMKFDQEQGDSDDRIKEDSYKVVSPTQARVQKDDHARTVQTDPKMTEIGLPAPSIKEPTRMRAKSYKARMAAGKKRLSPNEEKVLTQLGFTKSKDDKDPNGGAPVPGLIKYELKYSTPNPELTGSGRVNAILYFYLDPEVTTAGDDDWGPKEPYCLYSDLDSEEQAHTFRYEESFHSLPEMIKKLKVDLPRLKRYGVNDGSLFSEQNVNEQSYKVGDRSFRTFDDSPQFPDAVHDPKVAEGFDDDAANDAASSIADTFVDDAIRNANPRDSVGDIAQSAELMGEEHGANLSCDAYFDLVCQRLGLDVSVDPEAPVGAALRKVQRSFDEAVMSYTPFIKGNEVWHHDERGRYVVGLPNKNDRQRAARVIPQDKVDINKNRKFWKTESVEGNNSSRAIDYALNNAKSGQTLEDIITSVSKEQRWFPLLFDYICKKVGLNPSKTPKETKIDPYLATIKKSFREELSIKEIVRSIVKEVLSHKK